MMRRSTSSISVGIESISMRSRDAASSTGRSPCRAGSGRRCSDRRASPRRRARRPGCARRGAPRSAPSGRAGSRSCPRRSARRRTPAGSAARAPVLLDVLAVLVERRRADRAQLAAREHRLEHVAGVHRALGRARADERVQLVDEQDDARPPLRRSPSAPPSAAPRTRRGTSRRPAARPGRATTRGGKFMDTKKERISINLFIIMVQMKKEFVPLLNRIKRWQNRFTPSFHLSKQRFFGL